MQHTTPEKLFYYCSAEQALALLQTRKLRWYTPEDLNGTTEINHLSELGFDKSSLTSSSIKLAVNLIFGREHPKGDTPILGAIRRWREAQRFSTHEEAEAVLRDLLIKMVDHRFEELEKLMVKWQDFCKQLHLLSMFEKPDNFVVWDKHGDAFRGVVVRFKVGERTTFAEPMAMTYQNIHPEITTLKEQYSAIFHNVNADPSATFNERFLMKAPVYRNEREWRFLSEATDSEEDDTNERSYDAGDLGAIYLGPYIDSNIKQDIVAALHNISEDKKAFQMQFAKGRFDLGAEAV